MKPFKKLQSFVMAASFVLSAVFCPVSAAEANTSFDNAATAAESSDYEEYLEHYSGEQYPVGSISAYAENAALGGGAVLIDGGTDDAAVRFNESGNKADFAFEVESAGLYNITLYYRICETEFNLSPIETELTVDFAESSFDWLKGIELDRIWKDASEIEVDELGNESASDQVELFVPNSMKLTDIYRRPLYHYFDEGKHLISVRQRRGAFELYRIELGNTEKAASYKEYSAKEDIETKEYYKKTEAENYYLKSSASIVPECDPSSADTTPNDPVAQKLNYISGAQYKTAGSWIEWKIEVPNDGWYLIDMRVRQNYNSGLSSIRELAIDGELPFEEAAEINFPYTDSWSVQKLGGEEQYKFYLTAGEHVLRMTCAYGSLAEVVAFSQNVILNLNSLYNSVIMKIGSNPDKYRDYNLAEEIKGIDEDLFYLSENTKILGDMVVSTNNGKTGSAMSTIQTVMTMLENFKKDPDELALKMDTFKTNIEALASWANSLNEQPLDIDWIRVYSENAVLKSEKASFFEKLKFDVMRLCASFFSEYNLKNTVSDKNALTVWVGAGRDQLKVIKKLTAREFEKEYNADVTLAINTDITSAVLAGVGPDVCLFIDAGTPSVLAVRNVLEDLSRFDNFNEISQRFGTDAAIPFSSTGGCYALPLSLSWPMLFIRNDIFDDLGLSVPETWTDMYTVAAVLQRSHLEIGIPSHVGMFFTLLYQNGGTVFNDALETTFNDEHSLKAFSTWTSFFSEYSFPLTYDFFNRFRSGEMPIGIADYTIYAQLKAAAPEIRGQWQMYQIPGIADENGNINRYVSTSSATGTTQVNGLQQGESAAIMFNACKNKQLAWDYLCWFTSESVQAEYGLDIESVLGYTGRYATANKAALAKLPWTADELNMLNAARENVVMIDEYPGNYYISREVNNAFRSVVNNGTNPADILSRKNVLINKELLRKYKQFDIKAGEGKND